MVAAPAHPRPRADPAVRRAGARHVAAARPRPPRRRIVGTDAASGPTTRRRWRPRARCSATWASCSPAGCRTWRGRGAPERRHLWLDEMTRRNLELVEPLRAGARGCTLLETIDATVTPMGGRLLRQWLLSPLRDPAAIELPARRGRGGGARRPRPRPAARGARRRARPRAAGGPRRRRPRHAARARRAARLVPPPARRGRGAERARRRRRCRDGGRAAALADAVDELDLLADLAAELGRGARGPSAAAARRRRRDPRGLRRRARRAARAPRRRPAVHRLAAAAGAGAHRHLVAQGRLQQGLRLLPRDHQRARGQGPAPTTSGGRRWPPPSATSRPSSRSTRPRSSAPKSGWPRARRSCSARSARPVGQAIARIQRTARVLARLDVWAGAGRARRDRRYVRPDGARWVRPGAAREPASGDRAA